MLSTLAEKRPHLVDSLSLLKAELTNKVVEGGSEMKVLYVCVFIVFVLMRKYVSGY